MSALAGRGLGKHFGGVVALDEVSVDVAAGEMVGLMGPNGAGKTTLFNCLLGAERPDRGAVTLGDVDVTRQPIHRRARLGLARTFQRVELFGELTVRQHLLVAERSRQGRWNLFADLAGRGRVRPEENRRVQDILDLLGLGPDADRPAQALGVGRARLVELGRALATDPRVILADEPSSGLDEREREVLIEALRTTNRERRTAMLLIEHDAELLTRVTGRLYFLALGRVVAQGDPETVLADPVVDDAYRGEVARR